MNLTVTVNQVYNTSLQIRYSMPVLMAVENYCATVVLTQIAGVLAPPAPVTTCATSSTVNITGVSPASTYAIDAYYTGMDGYGYRRLNFTTATTGEVLGLQFFLNSFIIPG